MRSLIIISLTLSLTSSLGGCVAPDPAATTTAAADPIQAPLPPPPACAQAAADGSITHHVSVLGGALIRGGGFAGGLWISSAVGDHLEVPLPIDEGDRVVAIQADGFNSEGTLITLQRANVPGTADTALGTLAEITTDGNHQAWQLIAPHASGSTAEIAAGVTAYYLDIQAGTGLAGQGGQVAIGPILVKVAPAAAAGSGC